MVESRGCDGLLVPPSRARDRRAPAAAGGESQKITSIRAQKVADGPAAGLVGHAKRVEIGHDRENSSGSAAARNPLPCEAQLGPLCLCRREDDQLDDGRGRQFIVKSRLRAERRPEIGAKLFTGS